MKNFIHRLFRSYFGVLVLYRVIAKLFQALSLKHEIRNRKDEPLFRNVSELNTLMKDRAYLHDLEVPYLASLAKAVESTIVEIGCAFGASTAIFLAHINKKVNVHSIDPFIVDSMAPFQATQEKCILNVKRVLKALNQPEKINQWSLHAEYSYNISKKWSKPIDLLFIDGDHNYQAVKKDFIEWLPYVKKDGIILFHDSRKESGTPCNTFNRGWTGPTKLAQELRTDSRIKLIDEVFSITAWKKLS